MLRRLFYVIFVISCIVGIQADESPKKKPLQELVDDEIRNSMTRRSNRVEDKLKVLDNDKHSSKLWDMYKDYYNKTYSTSEDEKRSKKFNQNLRFIIKTKDPLKRTVQPFTVGLNEFSSMDLEEIIQHYAGVKVPDESETTHNAKPFFDGKNVTASKRKILPNFLDYRQHMNPIEFQGRCSSCYAFAALGTVEGTYSLKKQRKINLSKQQIIDCVSVNHCEPWYVHRTFDYIKQHHGLQPAQSYPYHAVQQACKVKPSSIGPISGYARVLPGDEEAMKLALNTFGPLTMGITITREFNSYTSGILDIPSCSKSTNHAVILVGYGNEFGREYWLARNSWGTWWGEQGYFKIARNKNNMCGVASQVFYVTV